MRVSFIVPTFNEASTVLDVLERVQALELEKQIVVVDDGSTDGAGSCSPSGRQPIPSTSSSTSPTAARGRRSGPASHT
jgi:Glycosyl transferase family 2